MARRFRKIITNTSRDMIQQIQDGELRLVAAALAFSTLLSLVPFMAVTLSIFKMIGGLEFLYPKIESFVFAYLEQGAGQQAIAIFQKIIRRVHTGVFGTTGAIALFLASFKLLHDMERGINRVWNVREKRPWGRRLLLSFAIFLFIPLTLAVYASFRSLTFLVPLYKSGYQGISEYIMLCFFLLIIYKVVPNTRVKWSPAFVSATIASLILMVLQSSFTWFATKIFTVNKVYGSFAALPVLCLWILAIWFVVLAGVAFCASTQERRWLEETYGFDY